MEAHQDHGYDPKQEVVVPDPELPHEIIYHEIVKRLSADSLRRFRCVSKSWLSLIPYNPSSLLLVVENGYPRKQHLFTFHFNHRDKVDFPTPTHLLTLSPPYYRYGYPYKYHAVSLNGLICLYLCQTNNDRTTTYQDVHELLNEYPVQVFNPCRQEITTLPPPSLHDHTNEYVPNRRALVSYSFGFSPVTKEYKVIQVQTFLDGHKPKFAFKICTLGWSSWRHIDIDLDNLPFDPLKVRWFSHAGGTGVCIRGSIYWLHQKQRIIVAFDVGGERFRVISLPEKSRKNNLSGLTIVEVRGCIATIHSSDKGVHDLWVLMEEWPKQVWFKEADQLINSFPNAGTIGCPLSKHVVHTGELLLRSAITVKYDTYGMPTKDYVSMSLLLWNVKSKGLRICQIKLPRSIFPNGARFNLITGYEKRVLPIGMTMES